MAKGQGGRRCKYADETGAYCIRRGRGMWGGYCWHHRHKDLTLDAHYAQAEVNRMANISQTNDALLAVRKFLGECMKDVREGKLDIERFEAVCKGVESHCRIVETAIEKLKIKHKIMLDSKRLDAGSPFKVLDIPTQEILKQVSDTETEIDKTIKDADTSREAANAPGPSIEGQPQL